MTIPLYAAYPTKTAMLPALVIPSGKAWRSPTPRFDPYLYQQLLELWTVQVDLAINNRRVAEMDAGHAAKHEAARVRGLLADRFAQFKLREQALHGYRTA